MCLHVSWLIFRWFQPFIHHPRIRLLLLVRIALYHSTPVKHTNTSITGPLEVCRPASVVFCFFMFILEACCCYYRLIHGLFFSYCQLEYKQKWQQKQPNILQVQFLPHNKITCTSYPSCKIRTSIESNGLMCQTEQHAQHTYMMCVHIQDVCCSS